MIHSLLVGWGCSVSGIGSYLNHLLRGGRLHRSTQMGAAHGGGGGGDGVTTADVVVVAAATDVAVVDVTAANGAAVDVVTTAPAADYSS